ncbi:hypothetical protein [Nostoc sp.]|uniref:hypothetical protein n=1 Tax=Nostoc sp. TaxID=1180 RepID=UPI002FF1CE0F
MELDILQKLLLQDVGERVKLTGFGEIPFLSPLPLTRMALRKDTTLALTGTSL